MAAKKMAATGRFDSIICIGCVLRGETSHYDYVASETARGIQLAQLDTGVPMDFACSPATRSNKPSIAPGLKAETKATKRVSPQSRWRTSRAIFRLQFRARLQHPSRGAAGVDDASATNPASSPCRCFSSGT